jgi:hypothetical protein
MEQKINMNNHQPQHLTSHRSWAGCSLGLILLLNLAVPLRIAADDTPVPTRRFEVRDDRPFLGGKQIDLWGLRCGNALMSDAVTERHVRNLDNMIAHGINCIGVYIQGSNGGWPDVNAGRNGYTADGDLKPELARRLEWLIREADKRGMVVMVGLLSPRKDQELKNTEALQHAIEETAKFLNDHKLRNVFVDLCHEYNSTRITGRLDHDLLREPDGAEKKAKLTRWFKKYAPDIPVGVCPSFPTDTGNSYPGMDVRIIQKGAEIPDKGFVVNVETPREEQYDNEGVFTPEAKKRMQELWESYRSKPNAFMLFHSAYLQGIGGKEGTGPHAEMGGNGTGPDDRGVRFYFDWVKENIGAYEYPRHAKGRK